MVSVYVARSGLTKIDEAAAIEGVSKSEMIRRLLALGLRQWERQRR